MKKLITVCLFSLSLSLGLNSCMKQAVKDQDTQVNSKEVIIPYISKIGDKTDLFITNTKGEKLRLTDDAFEEADPSILPNGKILFASKRTGTWQVYIINSDGTNLKAITNDKGFNNYRPAMSIDGSLLIVSDRETKPKIYSIDLDGGSVTKLTDGDNYYDYPSPLDDGTILYMTNQVSKWEIWKMNADGTNKKRITNMPVKPMSLASMPSYVRDTNLRSPGIDDGFASRRNIALNNNLIAKAVFTARDKDGDIEIFRINTDGTDLRNLTQMPGVDSSPVVTRNGKIVFTSDRDGTFDVWIMDADGTNPMNLTKEPYYASTR